jgi:DNA-directed RNA polymerase
MNVVLRDTFIRIHTEDVVGRLAAEFSARYKNGIYLAKIRTKSQLWKKIVAWREARLKSQASEEFKVPKATKAPRLDELMLEHQRMKLLRSSDPEEVEKGRNMVTPASLFEEMASEEDIGVNEELHAVGLGDMSPSEARLSADRGIPVGDPANIEEIHNSLPGGMEPESDMDVDSQNIPEESQDSDAGEATDESEDVSTFERRVLNNSGRKAESYAQIWLPLTFPPVPKKVWHPICSTRKHANF